MIGSKGYMFLLFIMPISILSQEEEMGNWMMYFGANRINDEFSILTELQYRNHKVAPNSIEQLLLRAGLNYHISKNTFLTVGYANIFSYAFESEQKAPETSEHRIWQQFILNNRIGRIKFEHRYRIEQRWVNTDYMSRFRYRLMLFVPLNSRRIEKGSLFIGLYNEIFVNTEQVFFDRNRLYGALGYRFHPSASVQIGVLRQNVNDYAKMYLQFVLIYNPDFRKK